MNLPSSRLFLTRGGSGAVRGLLVEFNDYLTKQDRLCDDLEDPADSPSWRLETHRAVPRSRLHRRGVRHRHVTVRKL
jgi:hypothetical protein